MYMKEVQPVGSSLLTNILSAFNWMGFTVTTHHNLCGEKKKEEKGKKKKKKKKIIY